MGFESWLHHLFMSYVTLVNLYSLNLFHFPYHGKIPTHKKVVKSNKIYSQRAWHSTGTKIVAILWDVRHPEMCL